MYVQSCTCLFCPHIAYSYVSSVISDISESKSSAVTVIRAEATAEKGERERERERREEEEKVIKIIIKQYAYLWYEEHHVYCHYGGTECTNFGLNTACLYMYIHIYIKGLRSGCGIITGGPPIAATPTCDLFDQSVQ